MKQFLILFVLSLTTTSYGQSGYLGRRHAIGADLSLTPSIRKTYRLNSQGDIAKVRQRIFFSSYTLNYSFAATKILEFEIGYRFAKVYTPTYGSFYAEKDTFFTFSNANTVVEQRLNFLEDPNFHMHAFYAEFKHYRLGSFAPVGKYMGLNIEYGLSTLTESDEIIVGKKDVASKDGSFRSKHSIIEQQSIHVPFDITAHHLILNFMIGRTYPLTKRLLLNVDFKFPILSQYFTNGRHDLAIGFDDDPIKVEHGVDFEHLVRIGLKKYTRLSLNVGLKYAF